jgi:hypothetical protein
MSAVPGTAAIDVNGTMEEEDDDEDADSVEVISHEPMIHRTMRG